MEEIKKPTWLDDTPMINVISKDEYERRVQEVFYLLWETLSKSFGPYGAPTIIYKFPNSHVTKDGHTIAHSLSLNVAQNYTNQAIANMAIDICGRVNTNVGDGTTTAIIATYSMFNEYSMHKNWFKEHGIIPRDILQMFNRVRGSILEELHNHVDDIYSTTHRFPMLAISRTPTVDFDSTPLEGVDENSGLSFNIMPLSGSGEDTNDFCERLRGFYYGDTAENRDYTFYTINNREPYHGWVHTITKDGIETEWVDGVSDEIVERIRKFSLYQNIKDTAWISSNGDEEMTATITNLYKQFDYPSIICENSANGEEQVTIIEGYRARIYVGDTMYFNSDERVAKYDNADILIFDCKVTTDIYTEIIEPALLLSRTCSRHLIVVAPSYDGVMLNRKISPVLREEFQNTGDPKLVICVCKAMNEYDRKMLSDFAMLCHTSVINRGLANEIIQMSKVGDVSDKKPEVPPTPINIFELIYAYRPYIPHITTPCLNNESKRATAGIVDEDVIRDATAENSPYLIPGLHHLHPIHIELGYCEGIEIGESTSIIHKFYYDERLYRDHYADAEKNFKEVQRKYAKLGTFNTETTKAQQRLLALRMKLALIEVGGDSELAIGMRRDVYDDVIKACASAFKNGVIFGCNLSTIQAAIKAKEKRVGTYMNQNVQELEDIIFDILINGFKNTFRTVLQNWTEDVAASSVEQLAEVTMQKCGIEMDYIFKDATALKNIYDALGEYETSTFFDAIMNYAIETGLVFDLNAKRFSRHIINSEKTDEEVLTAVGDLMGLLISGNQMVVTQRNIMPPQ